jgi:hypothetical protein
MKGLPPYTSSSHKSFADARHFGNGSVNGRFALKRKKKNLRCKLKWFNGLTARRNSYTKGEGYKNRRIGREFTTYCVFRSVIWAANLSVSLGSDAGVGTLRCFAECANFLTKCHVAHRADTLGNPGHPFCPTAENRYSALFAFYLRIDHLRCHFIQDRFFSNPRHFRGTPALSHDRQRQFVTFKVIDQIAIHRDHGLAALRPERPDDVGRPRSPIITGEDRLLDLESHPSKR